MEIFRFVHITDLHITKPKAKYAPARDEEEYKTRFNNSGFMRQAFDTAIIRIKEIHNNAGLDAIVLTGDIVDHGGKPGYLEYGKSLIAEKSKFLIQWDYRLANLGVPILLMPGNHDRYGSLKRPARSDFDAVFSGESENVSNWKSKKRIVFRADSIFHRGRESVAIIRCDFTLGKKRKNPAKYLGQGKIKKKDVIALDQKIAMIYKKHGQCAIVLALHYVPILDKYDAHEVHSTLKLEQSELLVPLIEKYKIKLIVCGHSHKNIKLPNRERYITGGCRTLNTGSLSYQPSALGLIKDSLFGESENQFSFSLIELEVENSQIQAGKSASFCAPHSDVESGHASDFYFNFTDWESVVI